MLTFAPLNKPLFMDLSGIIAIAGKPGLYNVVTKSSNGIIVESIQDKKRFPAYASHRVSALEDISIYTYDDDIPLSVIFRSIFDKESGGEAPNHKSSPDDLKAYLREILPDWDEARVYVSDIKKLLSWYNMLHKADALKEKEEEVESKDDASEETEAKAKDVKATDNEEE